MKNEILKRAMFAMPLSMGARNSGIMSGFDEEDMQPPEEETMPSMARTPQNPEILMNNLRGDMRSVDARRQELALMVGDEAADETPPEVLAMLQMQLGQQQQGIGALPQGAAMAPPPMPGEAPMGAPPMPPQDGMPPPPPQGGMPPGMQSAGPLLQGGAEEAPQGYAHGGSVEPPTPDGMPPMHAQLGAFVSAGTRAADMVRSLGPRVAPYLEQANATLGRTFMQPSMTQPFLENVRGPLGRYTAEQINRGGNLVYPTFTEGVSQAASQLLANSPRLASIVAPMTAAAGAATFPFVGGLSASSPMSADQQAAYDRTVSALNYIDSPENVAKERDRAFTADRLAKLKATPSFLEKPPAAPPKGTVRFGAVEPPAGSPILADGAADAAQLATSDAAAAAAKANLANAGPELIKIDTRAAATSSSGTDSLTDFLKSLTGKKKEGETTETRIGRIQKAQGEYAPLFDKLLASEGEDAKVNALLLLSDAGFKLASSTAPTFGMAFAEAASGVPRGFAALLAQVKDRKLKVDTAVLSKAIDDIDLQDKYAQAMQMEQIKGTLDIMKENMRQSGLLQRENLSQDRQDARENARLTNSFKQFVVGKDFDVVMKQLENSGVIVEDGGLGGRVAKNKQGSYLGFTLDPKDPTIQSAISSSYTLRPTDNPWVRNTGAAATALVTDKAQRLELGKSLAAIDNNLATISSMKNVVQNAYSPGTWFSDKVNNVFVPVSGGLIKPNFNTADAATKLRTYFSLIAKGSAAAAENGRVSNQQEEWARQNGTALEDPTAFFKNPELAAKTLNSMEAVQRNTRQNILSQLGYVSDNLVMETPSIGTKNDPFVIPADLADQKSMFTFLGSSIGKKASPNAQVYLKLPNGEVRAFNPSSLQQLLGAK